jgi:hypothetical protein
VPIVMKTEHTRRCGGQIAGPVAQQLLTAVVMVVAAAVADR